MAIEPTENAKPKWQMSGLLPVISDSLPEVIVDNSSNLKTPVVSNVQYVSPV